MKEQKVCLQGIVGWDVNGGVGDGPLKLVASNLRKLVFQTREFKLYFVSSWEFGKDFFYTGKYYDRSCGLKEFLQF